MARFVNLDINDIVNNHLKEMIETDLNQPDGDSCAVVIRLYNEWHYGDVIQSAITRSKQFQVGTKVEEADNQIAIFYFKNSFSMINFIVELEKLGDRTLHAYDLVDNIDCYVNSTVKLEESFVENLQLKVIEV